MSGEMAEKLRERIRECGISLRELARLTGLAQSALTMFMQGKDIRLDTAQSLCDYFGLVLTDSSKLRKPADGK